MSYPDEPLGDLVEASVGLHELFDSYIKGGFTEKQALYLVAQIMVAVMNKQKDEDDS